MDGQAAHKYQKPIDSLDGIVGESRLGNAETPTTYDGDVGRVRDDDHSHAHRRRG